MKNAIKSTFLLLLMICMMCTSLPLPIHGAAEPSITVNAPISARVTRVLLLGCDRTSGLTDSILLISVNEGERRVGILQIPRDTYAEYTKRDYKKLNGGMSVLGERGFKEFIGESLGIHVDYFAVIKLDRFDELVDAVGGVDVEIPQAMQYCDPVQDLQIDLPSGKVHLNGERAEQFVRYRSGYANADLGRLDAQKLFLRAFAKKCKALTPSQFFRAFCVALTGLQTDISITDAVRLSDVLRECDPDAVPMQTLAGQAAQGKSGAWYYVVNRAQGCQMINELTFPKEPISIADFDPHAVFDREQYDIFHKIYIREAEEPPKTKKQRKE